MIINTRMLSSMTRTARSLTISRSIPGKTCPTPWMQTPLDADPPGHVTFDTGMQDGKPTPPPQCEQNDTHE